MVKLRSKLFSIFCVSFLLTGCNKTRPSPTPELSLRKVASTPSSDMLLVEKDALEALGTYYEADALNRERDTLELRLHPAETRKFNFDFKTASRGEASANATSVAGVFSFIGAIGGLFLSHMEATSVRLLVNRILLGNGALGSIGGGISLASLTYSSTVGAIASSADINTNDATDIAQLQSIFCHSVQKNEQEKARLISELQRAADEIASRAGKLYCLQATEQQRVKYKITDLLTEGFNTGRPFTIDIQAIVASTGTEPQLKIQNFPAFLAATFKNAVPEENELSIPAFYSKTITTVSATVQNTLATANRLHKSTEASERLLERKYFKFAQQLEEFGDRLQTHATEIERPN